VLSLISERHKEGVLKWGKNVDLRICDLNLIHRDFITKLYEGAGADWAPRKPPLYNLKYRPLAEI
jgi:hypothetical protein